MKLRERDEPFDPLVERELDAVDLALAGERVDPDLAGWAELATLLRDERPVVDPAWTAELDERAALRFPPGDGGGSWRGNLARLRSMPPRRLAAPAGALATLAIVVVVTASVLSGGGNEDSASVSPSGRGELLDRRTVPSRAEATMPSSADSSTAFPAAKLQTLDKGVPEQGKIAPGTDRRQVDRDVQLALATRPENVSDTADEAISITQGLDGVVASSQVSRSGQRARATLQLTIPTRNVDAALDRLTHLADVRSLDESTIDITRPYVSAKDRLDDAEAQRRKLLEALGNATTDTEAEALRLQIDDARREISRAQAAFDSIARRARLSSIDLTIAGDPGASSADDGNSLGDWLGDALSVLRDVAGALLIAAAVVIPLGILAAIAWLAVSMTRRRRRDRALDG